jgi:hypothetical protein
LYPSGRGSRASSRRFTSSTSAKIAACSAGFASNHVRTSRRGITRVCPGDTGKPSSIAKASAFDAT